MSGSGDIVLRVERNEKYKTIKTDVLEDEDRVSWRAAGVHTYMTSRPDGWKFRRRDLIRRHTEGKAAVDTALAELKEAGYLRVTQDRGAGGEFAGWTWWVSETPKTDAEWSDAIAARQGELDL